MSALQLFQFPVTSQDVRVKSDSKDPRFCLTDVCDILDLSNPSWVASKLKPNGITKDEIIDSMGRCQPALFVNEANLYRCIMRSNKPQAEAFQDWVVEIVLPSIRKTGQYTAKPADIRKFQSMGLPSEMIGIIGAIDNNLDDPVAVAHYAAALNALQNVFNRDKGATPSTTSQSLPTAALEGLDADQAYIMKYLAKRGAPADMNTIRGTRHFKDKKINSVEVRKILETMSDRVKFEVGKGYSLI